MPYRCASGPYPPYGSTGYRPAAPNTPTNGAEPWPVSTEDSKLCHHRPNSLLELAEELYDITDGLMENLTPMLSMAAQIAILDGTEAITRRTCTTQPDTSVCPRQAPWTRRGDAEHGCRALTTHEYAGRSHAVPGTRGRSPAGPELAGAPEMRQGPDPRMDPDPVRQ
jgi:hypothetical protein